MRKAKKNFDTEDYLSAYAYQTDVKAKIDSEMAVGGLWDKMGEHQFKFLLQNGLKPESSLLDIGCGSLRGGVRFINYLDEEKYTGFDISKGVIQAGMEKLDELGLGNKKPTIFVNEGKNLRFEDLDGECFDYLLAQSVFSHLHAAHIEECFENLNKVMHADSRFFFTFHPGPEFLQRSDTDFEYSPSFFIELAEKMGYSIEDLSDEYAHPRKQGMMLVRLNLNPS
ncbi:class I SAM-dependent methyltransferase [Spiribacter sp. 221]|uniref:class I SAM-dependent methyltransferase n=1 Tax=Spiribacter onubensis TaxID=3122420 RepID=UPI00349F4372